MNFKNILAEVKSLFALRQHPAPQDPSKPPFQPEDVSDKVYSYLSPDVFNVRTHIATGSLLTSRIRWIPRS